MSIKNSILENWLDDRIWRTAELLVAVGFITLLVSLQIKEFPTIRTKTNLSEVFYALSLVRQDHALYFMEHGDWPQAQYLPLSQSASERNIIESAYFDGAGAFHLQLSADLFGQTTKTLSYVAALDPESPMSSVIWLCGYDQPIRGYIRQSKNFTNIPENLLGAACRSAKQP